MYRCIKYLRKVFLKLKKLNVFSKILKFFTKNMPKKQILKYIRNLYFKDKEKWKIIRDSFKKNTEEIKNFEYNFFLMKFFLNNKNV